MGDAAGLMIGLEIHEQLRTESKLFCQCSASYREKEPNSNICPVCTSQPGSKPFSLNKRAVQNLARLALAMGCRLRLGEEIVIQRKHYFYPDLPSNYQRTSKPIAEGGKLGNVRIRELHIEEDPGRYELRKGLVDYNRSGVPLVEIVTEPDFRSPEEAREFLEELHAITDYLECTRSEPGSTRIDANISLAGGNRVEIKNINSYKGVFTALKYEITRQEALLQKGMVIEQETRHYDEAQGITIGSRKKETAADYRYVPDPDVLPLVLEKSEIAAMEKTIPELPRARASRIANGFGIREEDAWVLVVERELADLFERLAGKHEHQKLAFWIRGALKKQLNYRDKTLSESGLADSQIEFLLSKFFPGQITEDVMEKALIEMLEGRKFGESDLDGAATIRDEGELAKFIDEVVAENPRAVDDYRAGNEKALNALAGMLMKKSAGRADMRTAIELIRKKIGEGIGSSGSEAAAQSPGEQAAAETAADDKGGSGAEQQIAGGQSGEAEAGEEKSGEAGAGESGGSEAASQSEGGKANEGNSGAGEGTGQASGENK